MASTDQLPETLEALKVREKELEAFLILLHRELKAATIKKKKRSDKERILPSYQMLKAVMSNIKDLEQAATKPDQEKEGTATDNSNGVGLDPRKQSTTESVAGPSTDIQVDPPQGPNSAVNEDFHHPDLFDSAASGDFLKETPWFIHSIEPKALKRSNKVSNYGVLRFVALWAS